VRSFLFFSCGFLLFLACKPKDKTAPEDPAPATSYLTVDTSLKCHDIPPAPPPFGWLDSTLNNDENIKSYIFNPVNPDEVICLVEGDITGYNKLFTFNLMTKTKIQLANISQFLPSVNNNGWILYSSVDNDLFMIKSNGDSVRQLSHSNFYLHPVWSFEGKKFFYFQQAVGPVNSCIIRSDPKNPSTADVIAADLPYFASLNKSDQIIYAKPKGTTATMVLLNMTTKEERELISGPYNSRTGEIHFSNVCVDRNDEYMYWTNAIGLFRLHLATLTADTLLKNCPNYTYDYPLVSFHVNELALRMHFIRPSGTTLFHEYKALQMNLVSRQVSELRLFH
jgi:hypothetical protein